MTGTDTVDEDYVRRFLTENPKFIGILRRALEQEEKQANELVYFGWEWYEVRAYPAELMKLVREGIVTLNYRSRSHRNYLLSNREAVKKALESMGVM